MCRYLPVYVLPALLVHRRKLLDPATAGDIWVKVARGAARSSLFLALYCTLAWRGVNAVLCPQSQPSVCTARSDEVAALQCASPKKAAAQTEVAPRTS